MTEGSGTRFFCRACGAEYELSEYGELVPVSAKGKFSHIPDWYARERECVINEINGGEYSLDVEVNIGVMTDYKAIYRVGKGRLIHNADGFRLCREDGSAIYTQKPQASYGLYSDYYWYEMGDVICIGGRDALYYCFPERSGVVAKTRIAAEELYRMVMGKRAAVFKANENKV